jgi:hypothetical protein
MDALPMVLKSCPMSPNVGIRVQRGPRGHPGSYVSENKQVELSQANLKDTHVKHGTRAQWSSPGGSKGVLPEVKIVQFSQRHSVVHQNPFEESHATHIDACHFLSRPHQEERERLVICVITLCQKSWSHEIREVLQTKTKGGITRDHGDLYS